MKNTLTKILFLGITLFTFSTQLTWTRRTSPSRDIYVAPDFYEGYYDHGNYKGYLCPGCKVVHPSSYKCPKAKRTSYCRIHSKHHNIWSRCPE